MKVVAVVPVKAATAGKQRLAPALDRGGREHLVRAMLGLVLGAVRGSQLLARAYVLTPDSSLVPQDVEWIPDTGGGLNRELMRAAAVSNADAMLILPADLPWIGSTDVDTLLSKARPGRAVVVPDKAELGTNALLLAPPLSMRPRFGVQSLSLHIQSANSSGAICVIHRCRNLARDIDEPADLPGLLEHPSDHFHFLSTRLLASAE
jgi:2-phospho-L-lactate guanylyltransferase